MKISARVLTILLLTLATVAARAQSSSDPMLPSLVDRPLVPDAHLFKPEISQTPKAAGKNQNYAESNKVLIIGDSLTCGPFGRDLLTDLTQRGSAVTLYCSPSSSAVNWIRGKNVHGKKCQTMTSERPKQRLCNRDGSLPQLASLLAANSDAKVIVALGTNSLGSPDADLSYQTVAKEINANGNSCMWIGPPHLQPGKASAKTARGRKIAAQWLTVEERNLNPFYDSLGSSVDSSGCQVIDSRDATAIGTPGNKTIDGIHRNATAAAYWESRISRYIDLTPPDPSLYGPSASAASTMK